MSVSDETTRFDPKRAPVSPDFGIEGEDSGPAAKFDSSTKTVDRYRGRYSVPQAVAFAIVSLIFGVVIGAGIVADLL